MKRALTVGALALSLCGGVAMAGGDKEKDKGTGGAGDAGEAVVIEPEREARHVDNRGVQVFLGGGVEGFTGGLAPTINPGPAYGATVAFKPLGWLGMELGYSGAMNSVSSQFATGSDNIVKNGGQALATIGLGNGGVQPYVAGGFGIDRYNVRGQQGGAVQDDTLSYVPVGVGLRTYLGDFTADARLTGEGLISQDLVPSAGSTHISEIGTTTPDARYNGMIRLGATF